MDHFQSDLCEVVRDGQELNRQDAETAWNKNENDNLFCFSRLNGLLLFLGVLGVLAVGIVAQTRQCPTRLILWPSGARTGKLRILIIVGSDA